MMKKKLLANLFVVALTLVPSVSHAASSWSWPPPNMLKGSHRGQEAIEIKAEMEQRPEYQTVVSGPTSATSCLFFEGLSRLIANTNAEGKGGFSRDLYDKLTEANLVQPVADAYGYFGRTGKLPSPLLSAFIACRKVASPEQAIQFAPLAVLADRKHAPSHLRLLVTSGTLSGWEGDSQPLYPYFSSEREALKLLSKLTRLTPDEKKRLSALSFPTVGEQSQTKNGLTFDLVSVGTRSTVGSDFSSTQASEGGTFVIVKYRIANTSRKTVTLIDSAILRDHKGREFRISSRGTTALAMEVPGHELAIREVQPGLPATAYLVFEVPLDSVSQPFHITFSPMGQGAKKPSAKFAVSDTYLH